MEEETRRERKRQTALREESVREIKNRPVTGAIEAVYGICQLPKHHMMMKPLLSSTIPKSCSNKTYINKSDVRSGL